MHWIKGLTLALAMALAGPVVHAQSTGLDIDLTMDDNVFLPGEDVLVGVRIANLSGRPMTFGATSDWLTFHVETKRGVIVDRWADVPVEGEFTLEPTQVGTKWWNIRPYFDFETPGAYVVHVQLRLPEWDQRQLSPGHTFTIQPSRKIWEIQVGVPPSADQLDAPPEVRRFSLISATRSDGRKLYARVTDDAETRIYRVILLDRLLSFDNREQQIDASSRLHILFQTGGNSYTYCVVNHLGELVTRHRYEITSAGRPGLRKVAGGAVEVAGGRRIPTLTDIPPFVPPPAASTFSAPPVPPPAITNAPEEKLSRAERRRRERAAKRN